MFGLGFGKFAMWEKYILERNSMVHCLNLPNWGTAEIAWLNVQQTWPRNEKLDHFIASRNTFSSISTRSRSIRLLPAFFSKNHLAIIRFLYISWVRLDIRHSNIVFDVCIGFLIRIRDGIGDGFALDIRHISIIVCNISIGFTVCRIIISNVRVFNRPMPISL